MSETNSNTNGKNIWSRFTEKKLITAICSLGDRVKQLKNETWRLNSRTNLSTSLWSQITDKLEIDHNEKVRHSLYNIWHSKHNGIAKLVKKELETVGINANDGDNGGINEAEEVSSTGKSIPTLPSDPSLPLPQKPNTRINKSENVHNSVTQKSTIDDMSLALTPIEWKAAFSRTLQKMNEGWTNIFYEKLKSCGITCALCFRKSHVKKGKRKHACKFFWCRATCTNSECTRSYFIILKNQPDVHTSALFLVRVSGIENHNAKAETMARQLRGEERHRVGK